MINIDYSSIGTIVEINGGCGNVTNGVIVGVEYGDLIIFDLNCKSGRSFIVTANTSLITNVLGIVDLDGETRNDYVKLLKEKEVIENKIIDATTEELEDDDLYYEMMAEELGLFENGKRIEAMQNKIIELVGVSV